MAGVAGFPLSQGTVFSYNERRLLVKNQKLPRFTAAFTYSLSSSSQLKSRTGRTLTHLRVRVEAKEDDEDVKQVKEMAAARKRWEALLRDGKVKPLTAREAGYAVQLSNKVLLDVRPSVEHTKAWVKGSTWIPIFDVEKGLGIGSLSKKMSNFLMGGWWSGSPTLTYQNNFINLVEEQLPKDADLIVACQKGMRSLAACEQMYNAGYRNLFWVQGGLEASEEEDFEREGPQPFKFAGIGGLSEYLGWTEQQRAAAAKEGWGYQFTFTARLIGLILLADAVFLGAQQAGHILQEMSAMVQENVPVVRLESSNDPVS